MTSLFLVLCGCFDVCSVIAQQTSSNGWSYTTADRWGTQYPSCALDSMQSPIPIPFSSLLPSDDIYLRIHSTGLTFTCVVNEDTFPTLVIRPKLNSPPVLLLSSQSREELQLTLITFHKPSAHQHPLSVAPQAEVTLFFEPTYLYSEEEQSRVAVSFFIGIHEASSSVMEMNPSNVNSSFLEKALENWVAGAEVQLTRSDMQSLLHNSVYEYIGSQPFPPCLPLRWYISTELLYTRSTLVAKIQDNSARPLQPRNFRRVRLRTVRGSELADPFTELNAFSSSLYHQIAPSKEHNEEPVRTEYIASVVVLTILVAFLLGLMVLITFFDITPQSSRPIHPMESPDFTNIEQESDEYEEEEEEEEEEENDRPSHVK